MGANICKPSREEFDDCSNWNFCGRKKEIDAIVDIINSDTVKALIVHGPKEIGKSRVIKKVLLNDKLKEFKFSCYIDLDLFSVDTIATEDFIDNLKDFCENVGAETREDDFNACERCELCQKDIACDVVLRKITNKIIKRKENCLVCFDNADKILNSDLREKFLTFVNTVTDRRKNIKMIVTSTTQVHMTSKAKVLYSLDKMKFEDLKELLVQVYDNAEVSKTVPKNIRDPWLNSVTVLCDGIPRCAETVGTMLREDDGLIKPVEMVELLLTNFLDTLNPELFPKDDRPTAMYQQELKGFKEICKAYQDTWLCQIADEMKDSEITPEEGLKAAHSDDAQVTSATFKMHGLRNYLDYGILQKGRKANETLSMKRLYKHLLSNVCNVVEENKEDGLINPYYCGKGLQLMKEEAKRIGLDLDNVEKLDALAVEKELKRVDRNIKQSQDDISSCEENDDDSGHSSTEDDPSENMPIMKNLQSGNGVSREQVRQQEYSRFDSSSGPYAMSYKDPEDGLHENGVHIASNRTEKQAANGTASSVDNNISSRNNIQQDNQAVPSQNGSLIGHPTGSETEEAFLRSGMIESPQKLSTLSNSYPTTFLRQAVEHSEMRSKRDRQISGHQICPTPLKRMGSADYEDADMPNNYVHTTEASDTDRLDNPNKSDTTTRVRYSSSSTDSGETRLSFEIKEDNSGGK